MKTTYRIRQPYADIFKRCADEFICNTPVRPERFIKKMKTCTGMAGAITGNAEADGLEKKNPVIVALGDSVTAGHFESLLTNDILAQLGMLMQLMQKGKSAEEAASEAGLTGMPALEITDARESYIEKFRERLIDKYEQTSVSVINAGIAGDVLPSMIARADRDVVRYDPDLILINGSLNWDDEQMGDASVYKQLLKGLVQKLKKETSADIVLITPNGDLPNTMFAMPGQGVAEPTTPLRCKAIREIAEEEQVCLADVRAVWDAALNAGCPWEELLANRINHPSVEGHEVYAEVLMKLFEDINHNNQMEAK